MKKNNYDCKGGPGFGAFLFICLIGWCLGTSSSNVPPASDKAYWDMMEASWKMEQNMREAQRAQELEIQAQERKWDDERMKRELESEHQAQKIHDETSAMMRAMTMYQIQQTLKQVERMQHSHER